MSVKSVRGPTLFQFQINNHVALHPLMLALMWMVSEQHNFQWLSVTEKTTQPCRTDVLLETKYRQFCFATTVSTRHVVPLARVSGIELSDWTPETGMASATTACKHAGIALPISSNLEEYYAMGQLRPPCSCVNSDVIKPFLQTTNCTNFLT